MSARSINAQTKGEKRKVVDGALPDVTKKGNDGPVIENIDFVREQGESRSDDILHKSGDKDNDSHAVQMMPDGLGESLHRHLSTREVDNLVGWANSYLPSDPDSLNNKADDELSGQQRRLGLSHIPTAPPPPSHIEYLHGVISERWKKSNPNNITMHMDASAYVAIGMAVEEVLTNALMPLAESHVESCRRMERRSNHIPDMEQPRPRKRLMTDDPFRAWTLTPAEAVAEMAIPSNTPSGELRSLLDRHSTTANGSAKKD